MRRTVMTALVLLAGATAVACGTGRKGSAGFHLPDGDPVKGRQAFVANRCHACHEVQGVALEPPVADPPVPVRLGGVVDAAPTDGRLATAILDPSHSLARGPRAAVRSGELSRMGDFTESLSLREMIDIVAFLQSTYEVAPPVHR
jgi:hypothetical protein